MIQVLYTIQLQLVLIQAQPLLAIKCIYHKDISPHFRPIQIQALVVVVTIALAEIT